MKLLVSIACLCAIHSIHAMDYPSIIAACQNGTLQDSDVVDYLRTVRPSDNAPLFKDFLEATASASNIKEHKILYARLLALGKHHLDINRVFGGCLDFYQPWVVTQLIGYGASAHIDICRIPIETLEGKISISITPLQRLTLIQSTTDDQKLALKSMMQQLITITPFNKLKGLCLPPCHLVLHPEITLNQRFKQLHRCGKIFALMRLFSNTELAHPFSTVPLEVTDHILHILAELLAHDYRTVCRKQTENLLPYQHAQWDDRPPYQHVDSEVVPPWLFSQ